MDILAWGIIPPALLLIYIYKLDKVEKEPVKLVLKALLFGCLSVIPVMLLEELGSLILDVLIPFGVLYNVLLYFIVVAGAEEGCKRMAMKLAVWKKSDFNYLFDAVLYMVAAGLGFALVENVEYMALFGTGIALGRLIPVHTICAVFMGLSLGAAKNCECIGDKKGARRQHIMSLAIPMLIHGAYDYGVSTGNGAFSILALVMVCVLTIVAFLEVKKTAKNDRAFYGMAGSVTANSYSNVNPVVPSRPVGDQAVGRQAQPVAPMVAQAQIPQQAASVAPLVVDPAAQAQQPVQPAVPQCDPLNQPPVPPSEIR